MVTMTCKCGSKTMSFRKMSEQDFPNGWETDCCLEKKKPEPKVEEQDKPKEAVKKVTKKKKVSKKKASKKKAFKAEKKED